MTSLVASALFGFAFAALALAVLTWRTVSRERSAAALLIGDVRAARRAREEGSLLRRLLPPPIDLLVARADLKAIQRQLDEAARPYGLDPIQLIRLRELTAILAAAIVALLFSGSDAIVLGAAALAALAVGYRLPDMWVSSLADTRQKEIQRSLPDTIDSLVLAMDAGLDLEAALRRLLPRLRGPLREAFDDVLADVGGGLSLAQALARLQTKTGSMDLSELVSLIQQSRRLGVGLTAGLRQRSEELRVRRRLRAQESAQQAPLKMSLPLVLFFLPALMIVFLAPAILSFIGGG